MTSPRRPLIFSIPISLGEEKATSIAIRLQECFNTLLAPELRVEVTLAANYATLARNLLSGRTDLGWAPPLVSARMEVSGGRPLVRAIRGGVASYRGALICRQDRPVDPDRLVDLSAAWVDRESTAGYLLPRAWARSRGFDPDQAFTRERFVGSYQAALQEVLDGSADITCVFASSPSARKPFIAADVLPPAQRNRLDVFAFTEEVPNDALVAGPSVDEATQQLLRARFARLADEASGRAVLEEIFKAESLEPAPDNAYRSLYGVVLASVGLLSSPQKCGACGWNLSLQARFCERCGEPTGRTGKSRADSPKPRTPSGEMRRPLPFGSGGAPVWSEERKLATVLFADLAGFTSISSRLEPDAVREFANECFEPLTQEIERRGGTVLKYIGDCVMAAFGVPVGFEDDPRRAVSAAVAMFRRLAELSPHIEKQYGAPINMRIGINTGLVMVGSVGSSASASVDIMGTAVNMASRIQNVAQPGEIVIGHATQRLVMRYFDMEALGPTELKGIPEPVPIFRVIGEKPEDLQALPATELSLEAGFNLREREMSTLRAAWEWVATHRRSRAVRLVGDAGLGKSRMLFHLRSLLANDPRRPHLMTAAGIAGATGNVTPLSVLGRLIRGRFGVRPDEPPEVARERVISGVRGSWPSEEAAEAGDCAELLATLAALHNSGSSALVPVGENAFNQDRILRACADWLGRLAAERPVCILMQDLQWADEASLEFIERLLRALKDAPVFFLSAERSELEDRRPAWALVSDVSDRIDLGPIPLERMRQFVHHILPEVPGFPEELKETLVLKSEGNPECARELIRLLIDRGAIVVGTLTMPWEFRADRLGELVLPDNIQGVLQARLDSLPPEEKEILKRASVVGRVFWEGAVEELAGPELRRSVPAVLQSLETRGLIRSKKPSSLVGQREFSFRTEGLREITYRSLPRQVRAASHGAVAEWLESRGQLWEGGHAELAGHLEAAGAPERARPHHLRAARHAASVYANREACTFYERALTDWPDGGQRAERVVVRRELGTVLAHVGRFEEALQALDAAVEDVNALPGAAADSLAWIELERALILKEFGRIEGAVEAVNRGLEIAAQQAPEVVTIWLLGERAYLRTVRGDYAGARSDCDEGLRIGASIAEQTAGCQQALAALHNALGGLHLYAGNLDDAETAFRSAMAHMERSNSQRGMLVALVNLGAIAFDRKDYNSAVAHFSQALALARKANRIKVLGTCLNNLGQAELARGNVQAALLHLQEARRIAADSGLLDVSADCVRAIAEARLAAGNPDEALQDALCAIEEAKKAGTPWFEAQAHAVAMDCVLGQLLLRDDDALRDTAHRHKEAAVRILRAANRPNVDAEVEEIEARHRRVTSVRA